MSARSFGTATAALLVMASMIGSGVFTTTGLLLEGLESPLVVLLVWLVAGVVSLCGALAYAELGAALPHNGGEYQLLARIYHPAFGFMAGWVSFIAGFSAPMAAAALAFGSYMNNLVAAPALLWATLLIAAAAVLHAAKVRWGAWAQNGATVITVLLGLALSVAGLWRGDWSVWKQGSVEEGLGAFAVEILSPEFATGLVLVAFSYSGYNAAVYVAGEVERPERGLSRALLGGTSAVMLLYLGVNAAFLMAAPRAQLRGAIDVADVATRGLLGSGLASLLSGMVALALLTTVSALVMTGPRVYEAMGRDYPRLGAMARQGRRSGRGPWVAITVQSLAAIIMVLTASFGALLTYMGVMLSLFALSTIVGVAVLRWREPQLPRPYRMPAYPVPVVLAAALSVWMLAWTVWNRPVEALAGVATASLGLVLYAWARRS